MNFLDEIWTCPLCLEGYPERPFYAEGKRMFTDEEVALLASLIETLRHDRGADPYCAEDIDRAAELLK